jgi:hypothetical protein
LGALATFRTPLNRRPNPGAGVRGLKLCQRRLATIDSDQKGWRHEARIRTEIQGIGLYVKKVAGAYAVK